MYEKGRVNGELFLQLYCQFLPRSLLQGEITLKARKLREHLVEHILLGMSDGGCVLVVSNFSLPRLGSLVACLQSAAIQTFLCVTIQEKFTCFSQNNFYRVTTFVLKIFSDR